MPACCHPVALSNQRVWLFTHSRSVSIARTSMSTERSKSSVNKPRGGTQLKPASSGATSFGSVAPKSDRDDPLSHVQGMLKLFGALGRCN